MNYNNYSYDVNYFYAYTATIVTSVLQMALVVLTFVPFQNYYNHAMVWKNPKAAEPFIQYPYGYSTTTNYGPQASYGASTPFADCIGGLDSFGNSC